MFYWNHGGKTNLSDELFNCNAISEIKIATAYLSGYGIDLLKRLKKKYALKKENVHLYLSAEFSSVNPHEQLEELSDICTTKIIYTKMFHAKVYWLKGIEDKLLYGSSNFTEGWFQNNIEFNSISIPTEDEKKSLSYFFDYCDSQGSAITVELIAYYRDQKSELERLHSSSKRLREILRGFQPSTDAFDRDEYDLDEYYFTFVDYETFFERNQKQNNSDIIKCRKTVQNKMLRIHEDIYPTIQKLGIACHAEKNHITSSITLSVYNKYHVNG